jgi:hypothetical protein
MVAIIVDIATIISNLVTNLMMEIFQLAVPPAVAHILAVKPLAIYLMTDALPY